MLVDKDGHILSTGYNGPAPGQTHCIDTPCAGAFHPSGQGLELCEAIHAEQNALMTCGDPRQVHVVYVTTAPCIHCTKMLLRTRATAVYFMDDYPGSGKALWENSRRAWIHYLSPLIEALGHLEKSHNLGPGYLKAITTASVREF